MSAPQLEFITLERDVASDTIERRVTWAVSCTPPTNAKRALSLDD